MSIAMGCRECWSYMICAVPYHSKHWFPARANFCSAPCRYPLPGGDSCRCQPPKHRILPAKTLPGIPTDREDVFREWAVGFLEFPREPSHSRNCAEQITQYVLPILRGHAALPVSW